MEVVAELRSAHRTGLQGQTAIQAEILRIRGLTAAGNPSASVEPRAAALPSKYINWALSAPTAAVKTPGSDPDEAAPPQPYAAAAEGPTQEIPEAAPPQERTTSKHRKRRPRNARRQCIHQR